MVTNFILLYGDVLRNYLFEVSYGIKSIKCTFCCVNKRYSSRMALDTGIALRIWLHLASGAFVRKGTDVG